MPRMCLLSVVLFGISVSVRAQDEHLTGRWEGEYKWPVVAIHAALTPDGKVLAYDSVGDDATETYPGDVTQTRAMLWDPRDNSYVDGLLGLGYNIFCSGLGLLPNGHVFMAGGNYNGSGGPENKLLGINRLTDYNPFADTDFVNRFASAGYMATDRWYPSITILANGEMVISGGVDAESAPEVRQADGSVRMLNGARDGFASARVYQWLKLAPNGLVAYLGPKPQLRYLHTEGSGSWESLGRDRDGFDRDYGSHALFTTGKVLVTGGDRPAVRSAVVVDLNTMEAAATEPMHFARRQHNLTVLADGSVLATGGFSANVSNYDYGTAVYAAELWDPDSQHWQVMASMKIHRAYHSTALLLPDGRVLSAGGGICADCFPGYFQPNAEIFSPPYLFRKDGSGELAQRPVITSAPAELVPGMRFSLRVAWYGRIAKVALVRLGAVTHSTNMDQRFIPLQFRQFRAGRLAAWAPPDNRIAPPGYYMLFVTRGSGVPSEAKILRLGGGADISYTQ